MAINGLYIVLAEAEPVVHFDPVHFVLNSNILNFALVVFFLVWIFKKYNVLNALGEKQQEIANKIQLAEDDKLKARQELESTREKVKNCGNETDKIKDDAKTIALSLTERIKTESVTALKDMESKAERTIKAENEKASTEITRDISKAAFIIAETHIKQAIDQEMHRQYIDEFVDSLDNIKVD